MILRPQHALVAALDLSLLVGCAKAPPRPAAADSAGGSGMAGMAMPADSGTAKDSAGNMPLAATLTFTAAQVQHGNVHWAVPTTGSIGSSASIPGEVVPNEDRTVRLGAPLRGQVLDVPVRPGDHVASGQPLVRLQSPEAGMAQADRARATAEVTSRRAQLQYAESARGRAERLLALLAIPRQDYERAVVDADQARASLSEAEADLRRAEATTRQLSAGSASGEVVLRAPRAGVVLSRLAVPGAVVEAGTPLVVVTDPASLWLSIAAPEQLTSLFHRGGRLRFTVAAYPADTFTARIDALGAGLDAATRTLPVRGLVGNRDGRLKPAMLATVTVDGPGSPDLVLVPEDAVQLVRGAPTVFIVHQDGDGGARLERRAVGVGAHRDGRVAIVRGVSISDTLVTQGAFAVKAQFLKGGGARMDM